MFFSVEKTWKNMAFPMDSFFKEPTGSAFHRRWWQRLWPPSLVGATSAPTFDPGASETEDRVWPNFGENPRSKMEGWGKWWSTSNQPWDGMSLPIPFLDKPKWYQMIVQDQDFLVHFGGDECHQGTKSHRDHCHCPASSNASSSAPQAATSGAGPCRPEALQIPQATPMQELNKIKAILI